MNYGPSAGGGAHRFPGPHAKEINGAPSIYSMCDSSWCRPDTPTSDFSRSCRAAVDDVNRVRLLDFLHIDTRPTFVLDLAARGEAYSTLRPIYCNPALLESESDDLLSIIIGAGSLDASGALFSVKYSSFRTWACRVEDDATGGGRSYGSMVWTKLVIMGQWSIVSGVPDRSCSDRGLGDLSPISPQSGAGTLSPSELSNFDHDMQPGNDAGFPCEIDTSGMAQPPSFPPELNELPQESINRLSETNAMESGELGVASPTGGFDWTTNDRFSNMSSHIKLARSVNWAKTPLGPMDSWSAPLRTTCNLVMRDPSPCVMFWGEEVVMIYNEAYIELIGELHPMAMGKSAKIVFREYWNHFVPIITRNKMIGEAVPETNLAVFLNRRNMLEETYFSFTFIPVTDEQGNIVGHCEPVTETTRQVVSERRLSTLLKLSEETSTARTMEAFWRSVLQGLSENDKDVPFAILYAMETDGSASDDSAMSSIESLVKECVLKGSLGIPEGHPAAPPRLNLLQGIETLMPYFQEAVESRKPTFVSLEDLAFPMSLLDGIQRRGFGDPCKSIVICPIIPTTSKNVPGFLIAGLNSRRPYDEDYQQFMGVTARLLATSLASVVLHEEEIRSREKMISQAELMRTQLAEQLAFSRQEVARNEKKFQRFAERADVAIFIVGADGHYTYRNQSWFEIFQLEADDLDVRDAWPELCFEEDLQRCEDFFRSLMVDHHPITFELRLRRQWKPAMDVPAPTTSEERSKQSVWVLCSAYPELSENGEVKEIVGCVTDISRQKWGEWLQKQRTEDALESKRQLENFIDTTSHEMRNPLGAIIQCADGIITSHSAYIGLANSLSDAERKLLESGVDAAQTIAQCSQHMKCIVDDVLTMSKLDSGLLMMTPVDTQPESLGRHAVKMFEAEARAAGVDLRFAVDPTFYLLAVDWVSLDPTRLLQIIINLVTNAIKFTRLEPRRTVTLIIGASIERPSNCIVQRVKYIHTSTAAEAPSLISDWAEGDCVFLQFAVQDTGRGLTDEEKELLFNRFSQASPRTHIRYGGSGLGLFISRRLTEMQGGAIGFSSRTRAGSTFSFYVKARRSNPPPTTPLTGSGSGPEPPAEDPMQQFEQARYHGMEDTLSPLTPIGSSNSIVADDHNSTNSGGSSSNSNNTNPSPNTILHTPPSTFAPTPSPLSRARSDSLENDLHASSPAAKRPSLRRHQSTIVPFSSASSASSASPAGGGASLPHHTPIHVLLVEDNLINQRVLANQLRSKGCLVSVANHGVEALEFLRGTMYAVGGYASGGGGGVGFGAGMGNGGGGGGGGGGVTFAPVPMALDVILMDWEMPVMDGLSAVREIRRMQRDGLLRGHVPVIAVTANVRNEQISQAMEAGMDDVVSKPFRVPELCHRMRGLIQKLKS